MNHYTNAIVEAEKEITRLESERTQIDTRIQHLQDFVREGRLITSNGSETKTTSIFTHYRLERVEVLGMYVTE